MLALGGAPYTHLLRPHIKELHERAVRHCIVVLRMVMDIVKSHIDLAQSSPFFAYDVALIRDACFFAPILLATIDDDSYASEDELRRDIDLCIHATRSMRFAYRQSTDRERSIETLWDLRCHCLHNKRAQGQPSPLALNALNLPSPSSTPPALSMSQLFHTPNLPGWETTQQQMTIALHPADQRSVRPGYASYPITPTVKKGVHHRLPAKYWASPQPSSDENVEAEVESDSDADAESEDDPDVVRVGDVKGKTSTSGKRKRSSSPEWERRRPAKMHNCPKCGKGFPRPSGLLTHMTELHTRRKRNLLRSHFLCASSAFACNVPGCAKRFAVRVNMTRHMKIHASEYFAPRTLRWVPESLTPASSILKERINSTSDWLRQRRRHSLCF
jgi:hypothetical protein